MLTITYTPVPSTQPRRQDFPTHDAYLLAWHTWRAIQQDGRLNSEELAAQWNVIEAFVKNGPDGPMPRPR
jgi:hypothetical protein